MRLGGGPVGRLKDGQGLHDVRRGGKHQSGAHRGLLRHVGSLVSGHATGHGRGHTAQRKCGHQVTEAVVILERVQLEPAGDRTGGVPCGSFWSMPRVSTSPP